MTDRPAVLLVDDRRENLLTLRAILEDLPADLTAALSGPEALEQMLAREHACVLIDVQMPEMDGFELAALMRGSVRTRDVPILFVTAGEIASASVARGYGFGAVDYVMKPFEPDALRSKVRVFVELASKRMQLAAALRDRERLVKELERALTEKARTGHLLDRIVEAAPIGIALLDRELRYMRVNAALAAINGLRPDEHVGRSVGEILPGLPGETLERLWRRTLETGEPALDYEISGVTPGSPSPSPSTWRESAYAIGHAGESLGLAVLVRDVTTEKRAAEMQEMLLGIVGHDLRTPLSALLNCIEVLGRIELAPEKRAATLARARRSGNRMTRLIRDLLDYTRLRHGASLQLDLLPTRIGEILAATIEEQQQAFPEKEIDIRGSGDGAGCWDRERLQELFDNLVSNALKYGDPASPVRVEWIGTVDAVRVEVANEGAPIPIDAQPTVFEPLTRGDRSDPSGAGLGLFIARAIVQAHGGRIGVRSGEGRTVFTVELPKRLRPDLLGRQFDRGPLRSESVSAGEPGSSTSVNPAAD